MASEPTPRERDLAERLDRELLRIERQGLSPAEHDAANQAMIAKWFAEYRAAIDAELKHAEARIADLNEHLAQYAGEPPHAQLVAELAGIRERARGENDGLDWRIRGLEQRGAGPDKLDDEKQLARDLKALIRRVVGLSESGGGDD